MSNVEGGWRQATRDLPDGLLLLFLLLGLYVLFSASSFLLGQDLNGIVNTLREITFLSAIYAMLALALNVQWGYAGLFNIGVAGFMAVGVYTTAILGGATTSSPPGLGLPLPIAVGGGILVTALLGAVAALPALRLRGDYLAIVTLAFSEMIRLTYKSNLFEEFTFAGVTTGTGGSQGINLPENPIRILFYENPTEVASDPSALGQVLFDFGRTFSIEPTVVVWCAYVVVILLFLGLFYWVLRRVGNSPFGRVLKAIREDEVVAGALGKDTRLFKVKVFALGCGLMGLAAILWFMNPFGGYVSPSSFMPLQTFYVFIAVIIGGAGSTTGSVVGGAVFASLLFQGPLVARRLITNYFEFGRAPETFFQSVGALGQADIGPLLAYTTESVNISALRLVLLGVVLIYLIQNRPEGLLGHRKEVASSIDLGERPGGDDRE